MYVLSESRLVTKGNTQLELTISDHERLRTSLGTQDHDDDDDGQLLTMMTAPIQWLPSSDLSLLVDLFCHHAFLIPLFFLFPLLYYLYPTLLFSFLDRISGLYAIFSNLSLSELFHIALPLPSPVLDLLLGHHPSSPDLLVRSPPSDLVLRPSSARHYPGLLNSSNNLCFLNAVLQALASLTPVLNYLDLLHAHAAHVPSPVATALRDTLRALNTPRDRPTVLRPYAVLQALLGADSPSRLFNSEQQDAQEVLVTLIEAVESEAARLVDALLARQSAPLTSLATRPQTLALARKIRRSPFRALMAHRIACATCGFASDIRHSPADHLSLTVPPKTSCLLESCLEEYTKLELLDDYVCRKCSLLSTSVRLARELGIAQTDGRKKRASVLKRRLGAVQAALEEDVEREVRGVEVDRTASVATTKQTMVARTPVALTVHLSRSTAFHRGVSFKNDCQVLYPLTLNLSQVCTTALLSSDALRPIAAPLGTGTDHDHKDQQEERFRLVAVVVHFGSHSFGHYITFRKVDCRGTKKSDGQEKEEEEEEEGQEERWFRISDEQVCEIEVDEVRRSNPFLLMYERVGFDIDDISGGGGSGSGGDGEEEEEKKWKARQVSWFDYLPI